MIEALLTSIILVLIGAFIVYVHETNKEKAKLVNALISRNAQELTNLTFADQTTIKPIKPTVEDLIPTDQLTDEQFDEMIDQQNAEALNESN